MMAERLTHFDEQGNAVMVDVGAKDETERLATASGMIYADAETLDLIESGDVAKGDVLNVARLAGIMAAKKTADLIPLCHPLPLSSVTLELAVDRREGGVAISATVKLKGRTGVEMEALTAVSVAALTVYDMCKGVDRGMRIGDIGLRYKSGGRSGIWQAP